MTLVLPYCSEQTKNLFFEQRKMPCVFDGEPLDFESALMSTDWPTLKDIAADYGPAASDDTTSTKTPPSGSNTKNCLKRKFSLGNGASCNEVESTEPKRTCIETSSSCAFSEASNGPSSESLITSNSETQTQEDSVSATDEDEELFTPRRRVLQMWNSRQRLKDERKRVLKMSVSKLTEIEDPELWLLRSVLINNTIKRLHQDIRNERQAKVRHRQNKIDFYNEKYEATTPAFPIHQRLHTPNYENSPNTFCGRQHQEDKKPVQSASTPSDSYDDTSCDEIFGISEDFLRVTIPDRRVSSPIPTSPVQDSIEPSCSKTTSSPMEVDTPSQTASSCASKALMDCDISSSDHDSIPGSYPHSSSQIAERNISSPRHFVGGNQCSTQYRTNSHDCDNANTRGDSGCVFAPRVPILDSVVYHSLLASLESS